MLRFAAVLLLFSLVACREGPSSDVDRARAGCRARYDAFQRWVTGQGKFPETEEEWAQARGREKDPWGRPYDVEVEGGTVRVWSDGPDREPDTSDDLCYPPLPDGR
jgi:hypothetical protein